MTGIFTCDHKFQVTLPGWRFCVYCGLREALSDTYEEWLDQQEIAYTVGSGGLVEFYLHILQLPKTEALYCDAANLCLEEVRRHGADATKMSNLQHGVGSP